MKKILCPTDFSDAAHTAIAYAAKLAKATDSELTLLNVQSLFDFTPVEMSRGKQATITAAIELLENQSRDISKTFKIACYALVEPTLRKLSTVIHDKSKQFDLIVMGTNGPDDLFKLFGGSNTYNAITISRIPLLVIPPGYLYSEISSMVFAFDYLRERSLPIGPLAPFVKALRCTLTVLQVQELAYSKMVEEDLQELQIIFNNLYGDDLSFNFDSIRSSEPAQGINDYLSSHESDILALCSVHRNLVARLFHKSVIKDITAVCKYPIYVFHE